MVARHDPVKSLIALQQPIERAKLFQGVGAKRLPFAVINEFSKPFSERARLGGNTVEFTRLRPSSQRPQRVWRHKLRLLQPSQKSLTILDPVDLGIHGRGNRVQEIKRGCVGNEYRGQLSGGHSGSPDVTKSVPYT